MNEKYIQFKNGAYRLDRRVSSGRINASFDNLDDAVAVREIYIQHNWVLDLSSPSIYSYNDTYYLLYKPERILKILYKSPDYKEIKEYAENYVDMDYISKEKKASTWRIIKSIRNRNEWFGSYNTLEETLKYRDLLRKHAWDKEYFEEIYKESETKQNEYIYHTKNRYIIRRTHGDVQLTYGSYTTIEEARKERDKLIEENWQHTSTKFLTKICGLWWVKKDQREGKRPYTNFYDGYKDKEVAEKKRDYYLEHEFPKPLFHTNIFRYITRQDNNYYVEKTTRGVKMSYPVGKNLIHASALRDILEYNSWTPPLREYYLYGNRYVLDLIDEKYVLDLVKKDPTPYINLMDDGKYEITYNNQSWGKYDTLEDANEMLQLLVVSHWDRQLYQKIREVDRHIYSNNNYHKLDYKRLQSYYKNIDDARIIRDYLQEHEGIPYEECITKTPAGYSIQVEIYNFYSYNRIFKRLEVAREQLKDHVLHGLNGNAGKRNIHIINGKYVVSREHNSRYTLPQESLEEAQLLRDMIIDNNWEIPSPGEYLFDGKTYKVDVYENLLTLHDDTRTPHLPRNIKIFKGRYMIIKIIEGKTNYYGIYNTLDEAVSVKQDLIEHDWNIEYYRKHYKKKVLGRPNKKNIPTYIRKTSNNKYEICKSLNGKLKYFGRYNTISEAVKVRDKLISIDWNYKYYRENIAKK